MRPVLYGIREKITLLTPQPSLGRNRDISLRGFGPWTGLSTSHGGLGEYDLFGEPDPDPLLSSPSF